MLNKEKIFFYDTTIGEIAISEHNNKITNLYLKSSSVVKENYEVNETEIIKKAYKQLIEYFDGKRKDFSLPLAPSGAEFMKKVWNALIDIPYGETRSYKDIAEIINHPKAYRAVGLANNRNPIPIFIPCHRVIGADKKLVGYGGGLDIKEKLLKIEGVEIK